MRKQQRPSAWRVGLLLLALLLLAAVLVARSGVQIPASAPPSPERVRLGASSDWYALYFTVPLSPDDPAQRLGGLDERLVAAIDSARQSVDTAIYGFDLANVAEALARAQARGARVRMVTDTDTVRSENADVQLALAIVRRAGIPIVDDRRSAIMHHKFAVVDGRWVWTGSWNWTTNDTYRLNNHAAWLDAPDLAARYAAEFERMFVERRFGPAKPADPRRTGLSVDGVSVEPYFAPRDPIVRRLVERIGAARDEAQFLAFSFTHDDIGRAFVEQVRAGLPVRGVFEATGSRTEASEMERLRQAGAEVMVDGNPYAMHHKAIVIDRRTAVFGSFNFSRSAAEQNDENLLIVDDERLAAAFLEEVERIVAEARGRPTPSGKSATAR